MTNWQQKTFEIGFWLLLLPAGWGIVLWNRVLTWQRFDATIDWSRLVIEEVTSCLGAMAMVPFVVWWSRIFRAERPWWRYGIGHVFGSLLFTLGHFSIYIGLRIVAFAIFEARSYEWQPGFVYNLYYEYQQDVAIYAVMVVLLLVYGRFVRDNLFRSAASASASASASGPGTSDRVLVMTGRGERVLPVSDVLYLQSARNYVSYFTAEGEFVVRETLSNLAQRLAGHGFVRVHRSYVVNLHHVREIVGDGIVLTNDSSIPLGRSFRQQFRDQLGNVNG